MAYRRRWSKDRGECGAVGLGVVSEGGLLRIEWYQRREVADSIVATSAKGLSLILLEVDCRAECS